MADLGAKLWQAEDAKTAAIRLITLKYTAPCDSKAKCPERATTGVECRDKIGHLIRRKDFLRPARQAAHREGAGLWASKCSGGREHCSVQEASRGW
jgi:hypothetical protein